MDASSSNTASLVADVSSVANSVTAIRESAFSPSPIFNLSATRLANDLATMGSLCTAYYSTLAQSSTLQVVPSSTNCSTAVSDVQVDVRSLSAILQSVTSDYALPTLLAP